jgi:hypothetical protein
MNAKLFINYRRDDTAPYAGRLTDHLTKHFGKDQVFIDIDQIEPGEDFLEAINRKESANGKANDMIVKEEIRWRGMPKLRDAVLVNGKTFVVSGNVLKTACIKNEWQEDVDNPHEVIRALKHAPLRIDVLRFRQRIPDSTAKYPYYKEWRDVAAIPIKTFEYWWEKQINCKTRNMVRKSQKAGVVMDQVKFNDELVRGIMGIFNESPIRRGKPFWHYGKDFNTVKKQMSADLDQAIFIAAHYYKELIGYIKLLIAERYAIITLILDKRSHRDKSPMNGMIAKAVEICASRSIAYLIYTVWRRGDHGEFQQRNGFERIPVPEYFVPLTMRGKLAVRFGLHKGIKGALPEKVTLRLLALRSKWYAAKQNS